MAVPSLQGGSRDPKHNGRLGVEGHRLRVCGSLCFQENLGGSQAGWRKEPGNMGRPRWGEFESSEAAGAKGWPVQAAACISVCPRNWFLFSPLARPELTSLWGGPHRPRQPCLGHRLASRPLSRLALVARWPLHKGRTP